MTIDVEHEQPGGDEREHPVKRIERDHHTLRDQIEAISGATSRPAVLTELLALSKMLQEHFELEEQIDGLYDDLQTRRPSISKQMDALRDEHRGILDDFEALCRKLREPLDNEQAEEPTEEINEPMMRDVESCLERLRRHEREESGLICDVYYTDEGGHG